MSKNGLENPGFASAQPQAGPYPPQQGTPYPPQQGAPYPPQGGQYQPQQGGQYPPQHAGQYPSQPTGQYPPQQNWSGQFPNPSVQQQQQTDKAPVPWDPNTAPAYQGEMGAEDVDENAQAVEPNAPPPSFDAVVSGYENVNFQNEANIGPPPSYDESVREVAHVDTNKVRTLTDDDAKEALLEYVSQQCCYGKGAAEDMKIKEITSTSALHYSLETFTETRSTKWTYIPYTGGIVDGPQNGPAPSPWDIHCPFGTMFQTEVKKVEVPHTASVRPCHRCYGCGFNRCYRCTGRGRVRCSWCHGSGRRSEMRDGQTHRVSCTSCMGTGRKRCMTCHGTGMIRCNECNGYGQIKQFIQLTVSFQNRLSDHIVERTDMPDHLIRDVNGDVVFEQVALRVGPIQDYPEQEINRRASEIVGTHSTSWPNDRVLQQRQRLRSIPVYECRFKFNDKEGRFWVYGNQRKVYTEDYPHTCCCCTIL